MAKAASKIRKRDLDPQLFMELASQIDGKINMEELLSNYIRKDDVIGEYQLPPKYRTEVTKELQNLDASVQDIIKKDTEQDAKHNDLEHRMQVVENTMHIGVTEDQDVSPIIGTQVAANTTNISRNSASIKQLSAQLTVQADTEIRDKMELQNSIDNISRDVDDKLKQSDEQVKEVKTLLEGKRNVTDLITVEDLEPTIKKDMETVIAIGEKTASAFNNLDDVIMRVNECNSKVAGYDNRFDNIENRAATNLSELTQKITELGQTVESTSATRVQNINTELDQIRQNATSLQTNMETRFQSVEEEQTLHKEKLEAYDEKIENVAQANRDNEQSIGTVNQSIDSVTNRVSTAEAAIKQAQEQVTQLNSEKYLHPNIDPGQTLCVSDILGTVIGKDLFYGAYFADNDTQLVEFQSQSLSPIFSPGENVMYVLKTAEEIAREAEEANNGVIDPGDAGGGSTTNTDTPNTPSDTPADTPTDTPSDTPANTSTDTPAENQNTPAADDQNNAAMDPNTATNENIAPSEDHTNDEVPTVDGGDVVVDDSNNTNTNTNTSTDNNGEKKADGSELTDEEKKQAENARKYKTIENFLQSPENHCIILYDMAEGNVIRGYSDNQGLFHEFTAFTGTHKPIDFEIEAGASYEIQRISASSRLGLEVRLMDQVKTSQTYGKWINSEGVATVAYGDNTVTVYNSSDKTQKFRILEG